MAKKKQTRTQTKLECDKYNIRFCLDEVGMGTNDYGPISALLLSYFDSGKRCRDFLLLADSVSLDGARRAELIIMLLIDLLFNSKKQWRNVGQLNGAVEHCKPQKKKQVSRIHPLSFNNKLGWAFI